MAAYIAAQFDVLLDQATIPGLIDGKRRIKRKIVDLISRGNIQPKYALNSIMEKMDSSEPQAILLTIDILDMCVLVCGDLICKEVNTTSYMKQLKEILETTPYPQVKSDILDLIQDWAQTIKITSNYSVIRFLVKSVQETVEILKAEGYEFSLQEETVGADTAAHEQEEEETPVCCFNCCQLFQSLETREYCMRCNHLFCNQCFATRSLAGIELINDLICLSCKVSLETISVSSGPNAEAADALHTDNQVEDDLVLAIALAEDDTDDVENDLALAIALAEDDTDEVEDDLALAIALAEDDTDDVEDDLVLAIALAEDDTDEQVKSINAGLTTSSNRNNEISESICCICTDKRVDSICQPCGHLCMCYDCGYQQWRGLGNGSCPLCRENIEEVIRLDS